MTSHYKINIICAVSTCLLFNLFAVLALFVNIVIPKPSYADVIYTSIKSEDCFAPPQAITAGYTARGLTVQQCKAPKKWRLFVVSSDERSWIDIAYNDHLWTTEQEVVYRNQFGLFPNIGSDKAEWRVSVGRVSSSMIFRISAEDPTLSTSGSQVRKVTRLYVIGLDKNRPALCGIAKTNEGARLIADKPDKCTTFLPEVPSNNQQINK